MKCGKTKKCPNRGPQTKMIKFPREFSGHIKKLQSHKKAGKNVQIVCFESSSKPFITRCHNHHHISLLNTRLLSWQEGRAIGLGSAFPQKNSTVVTQGTTVIHSYIQV